MYEHKRQKNKTTTCWSHTSTDKDRCIECPTLLFPTVKHKRHCSFHINFTLSAPSVSSLGKSPCSESRPSFQFILGQRHMLKNAVMRRNMLKKKVHVVLFKEHNFIEGNNRFQFYLLIYIYIFFFIHLKLLHRGHKLLISDISHDCQKHSQISLTACLYLIRNFGPILQSDESPSALRSFWLCLQPQNNWEWNSNKHHVHNITNWIITQRSVTADLKFWTCWSLVWQY